jgi:hypothetical protein
MHLVAPIKGLKPIPGKKIQIRFGEIIDFTFCNFLKLDERSARVAITKFLEQKVQRLRDQMS